MCVWKPRSICDDSKTPTVLTVGVRQYPSEYGREFVKDFEISYFNLGSEWIIHDEESEPSGPEDIAGYGQYILASGYSEDEVKAELADITGVAAEDIVLYRFSGWVRSAQYEVA